MENDSKPKKRILLVEDEPHLAFNLEFNLQTAGFEVMPAATGQVALDKFTHHGPFDLIIMDVMIPEIDGIEVTKIIRQQDNRTGILMLTARAAEEDIIAGLEAGADDYLTKPFLLKELLLRVKRMAARSDFYPSQGKPAAEARQVVKAGSLTLYLDSLELEAPNGRFSLTLLEANLLNEFMTNVDRVMTREHLLRRVWGINGQQETRTVDNFVMRLRRMVEVDPSDPLIFESVRGRGYRFNAPGKLT